MIGLAPGGGGYAPARWATSGRFTPAAATRISTSSARGVGTGPVVVTNTSGPPGPVVVIWVMLVGRVMRRVLASE